ncbi:MAG TPA: hypothetical protein ENN99_12165 [Chloroflexi bacterium]|nr:hypothetical protein [Chloroflexota bacterium]
MDNRTLSALFTKESLLSLQGAAAATLLVPNVLTYLIGGSFRPYEKWVALGVAVLISLLITRKVPGKGWSKWIVGLLNGLVIFWSAVGMTEMFGYAARQSLSEAGQVSGKLPFFHSWYP